MAAPTIRPVPSFTARANTRWINPTSGSDSNNGLTKAAAWRSVKVADVPANTELVFVNGTHTLTASIFSDYGSRPTMAASITFRSETYRGAVLVGSNAGEAFTMVKGLSDYEIYGLDFRSWGNNSGNGLISVKGNANGVRIIGNNVVNPGNGYPFQNDHFVYFAGGSSYATAPRNVQILNNDVTNDVAGMGAALLHSYSNDGGWDVHDAEVAYNTIRGSGWSWVIILEAGYAAGSPANIAIHDNDIQVTADGQALIDFFTDRGMGTPNRGVDSTCVIRDNIFRLIGGTSRMVNLRSSAGGAATPTIADNYFYRDAGGISSQFINFTLPASNTIGLPSSGGGTGPGGGSGGGSETGGGTTSPEIRSVAGLVNNAKVFPASRAIALSNIARTIAKGGVNAAQTSYVQNQIGAAGVALELVQGGALKHRVTIPGLPSVKGNQVLFPLTAATYQYLENVLASGAIVDRLVALNGSIGVTAPNNGAAGQVSLTRDLGPGVGLIATDLAWVFDSALDGTTQGSATTPALIPGAFDVVINADSVGKGSGTVDGVNEATYVSYRGALYRTLAAAGKSFTVKGAPNWPNGVRDSTGNTATAAQGGTRPTTGTTPTGKTLIDQFKAANPASSYASTIVFQSYGANDVYAGVSAAGVAANVIELLDYTLAQLPGVRVVPMGLIPGLDMPQATVDAVADALKPRDNGTQVFYVDPRPLATATTASGDFYSGPHTSKQGGDKIGTGLATAAITRILTATTSGSPNTEGSSTSTTLAQLIAQNTAHEVMPYVANPNQQYARKPFKVFEAETYGGAGTNFSLLGANCMPSWFNPSNKEYLSTQWFVDFVPWWVVCCQRNSSGGNANSNPNAAVLVDLMQLLIWRNGTLWDAARDGTTSWAGSYNYDFTSSQAGASWRTVGTSYICKPSENGQQVVHGGGAGILNINSPTTVAGGVFRVRCTLVDYRTGLPLSDPGAKLAIYVGTDVVPRGGSANTSFLPLNFAPGLGCGAFIEARSTPRYATFTTLLDAQIRSSNVPGYN